MRTNTNSGPTECGTLFSDFKIQKYFGPILVNLVTQILSIHGISGSAFKVAQLVIQNTYRSVKFLKSKIISYQKFLGSCTYIKIIMPSKMEVHSIATLSQSVPNKTKEI